MGQYYTVTKAFKSKNQETGELDVDEHGNQKWLFQVEGQQSPGWMNVKRKAGAEVKPGDQVYGRVESWPNGKAKFVREQPPREDGPRQVSGSKPASTTSLERKVDYIIAVLEASRWFVDPNKKTPLGQEGPKDVAPEDIDEGPVDLSQIDY